jgi:soluble lytic murein transglycosylase-like protein
MADLPTQSSDTNSEDTTKTSPLSQVATQVKMTPGGKGQLATLSAPAGVLMSEESSKSILNNMQKMLDEYNSPYKQFQDSLQKAHAWTMYDKTPAFREINAQEEQDRANKYNIAQSMASFQANQASNRNLAKSLLSQQVGGVQGAPTTAQAGAGLAAQSPIDSATQAEIDRLILQEGNVGAAQELRKKAYTDYLDQSMRNKFNVDWDAPVQNVMINGVPKTITRRAFSQLADANPGILKENPQLAKEIIGGGTAPGVSTAALTKVESGGDPNAVSSKGATGVLQVMPNTKTDPGFGVTPAKDNSPTELERVGRDYYAAMQKRYGNDTLAAIAYNMGPGAADKWLSESKGDFSKLPAETRDYIGKVHVAQALLGRQQGPTTAAPTTAQSPEEYQANLEKDKAANQAFLNTTHKALSDKVAAQENDILNSKQILGSIEEGGKFGPGTSIDQALSTALQAVGVKPNKAEQIKYLNNLNIEQARQLFSASGARAAMGAQFTENESNRFLKTLAGIDNPKEYIKQVYQLKIAEAKLNQARLDYLNDHPTQMAKADRDWRNSSERERILRENAPIYMKISDKADATAAKDKGATPTKTVVKQGKVTDPKHPDYNKTVYVYSDGTRETK